MRGKESGSTLAGRVSDEAEFDILARDRYAPAHANAASVACVMRRLVNAGGSTTTAISASLTSCTPRNRRRTAPTVIDRHRPSSTVIDRHRPSSTVAAAAAADE